MELKEYANMERVEKGHWYNVGKREFVRRWIAKVRPPQKDEVLLDCGAGTGLSPRKWSYIAKCSCLMRWSPR